MNNSKIGTTLISFMFIFLNFFPQRLEIAATDALGGFPFSFVILLGILSVIMFHKRGQTLTKPLLRFLCLIFALFVMMMISISSWSVNGAISLKPTTFHFLATLYFIIPLFSVIVGALSVNDAWEIKKLTRIFIFVTFLQTGISFSIFFFSTFFSKLFGWSITNDAYFRLSATALGGGGTGPLSLVLLIAILLCYEQYLETKKHYSLFLMAVCLFGLVFTYSRAPLLISLAGIVLMSTVAYRKKIGKSATRVYVFITIALLASAIHYGVLPIDQKYLLRENLQNADTFRIESAKTALQLIERKPLLGFSPGELYIRDYENNESKHIYLFDQFSLKTPHNLPLLLAAENGLIFLLLWLTTLAILFGQLLKPNISGTLAINGYWFVLAAGIIHSLISDTLGVQYRASILFWLIIGLGFAHSDFIKSKFHKKPNKPKKFSTSHLSL